MKFQFSLHLCTKKAFLKSGKKHTTKIVYSKKINYSNTYVKKLTQKVNTTITTLYNIITFVLVHSCIHNSINDLRLKQINV